jgi:hypothetical protein
MRRLPSILLAMLVFARPHAAHARTPALDVPGAVTAGQRLVLRWDGPTGTEREVELELSLDGGRWVRISPELEASEGCFAWRVPEVASARARLRLRAGGEGFERELVASAEFRIASRSHSIDGPATTLDWWRVGEHTHARGWEAGPATASLSSECAADAAEAAPPSHARAPGPEPATDLFGIPLTRSAPGNPRTVAAATCRCPMRL